MKRILLYSVILILFVSCKSQQLTVGSLCGSFDGLEGRKSPLSTYVLLELNSDNTCSLVKLFDLSKIECKGEWSLSNGKLIEIMCNRNPVLNDIERALQGGGYIEGNIKITIWNKNQLKLGNTILKRKK